MAKSSTMETLKAHTVCTMCPFKLSIYEKLYHIFHGKKLPTPYKYFFFLKIDIKLFRLRIVCTELSKCKKKLNWLKRKVPSIFNFRAKWNKKVLLGIENYVPSVHYYEKINLKFQKCNLLIINKCDYNGIQTKKISYFCSKRALLTRIWIMDRKMIIYFRNNSNN